VRAAIRDGAQRREIGEGSVLIADVSGFTPLTEALARRHGARRGAEEVAALLNRVYGALVTEVDRAAGSVVEFAGDAVCCCFDGDDGSRALRCGLRMQASMAGLRAGGVLAEVTVAIATGPFRRLGVGDPALRVYEVVAGPAVDRVSAIAPHAGRGEVLVDGATADALGERLVLVGRRGQAGDRCAAVGQVIGASPPDAAPPPDLDAGLARPWVPAGIYDRLREDDLLVGELRSVVPLFAGFSGIDYAATDAGQRLDAYVRFAQTTIASLGGTVFTVTVDDKGSYLCAGFGAPVAHDNDPQRAAAAALALVAPPPAAGGVQPAGIGMTRGRMYAGTYGGATRRTFGLQGTRTNLAARLMQSAAPDQILVDEPLAALLQPHYELRALPALRVKGHTTSVASRELVGARQGAGSAAAAPVLVNRVDERARIEDLLRALLDGEGGVVLLEGEPGIGKSRLVRHLAERAAELAIAVHTGAGDPIERGDPYHGWRMVFGGDLSLGSLPDELSGEARAEATRDLLAEQLASVAADSPTLVVLEDAHWLDSASLALATRIATAPGRLRLVITTRPLAEAGHAELERLAATAGCERIRIGPLAAAEVRALAAGAAGVDLPATIATLIESKAGGNPLFTRELALALRDRGLLAGAAHRGFAALGDEQLESPDSVEAVIASRVDRLPPRAQAVIKVGSVLGRTFSTGALRALAGDDADVQLAVLEELELLGYKGEDHALEFRHAVIRDVVYERLLYAQRRDLHRRAAGYLERAGADAASGVTDAALAHHWERAEVPDRAARRFASAGEAAFRAGAFRECVDMLERALTLSRDALPDAPRARWQWQIAQSCYRLGELELCHRMAGEAIAGLDRALPVGAARLAAATARELLCQVAYRALPRGLARRAAAAEALPRGLPRRAAAPERERLSLAVESQRIMAGVYYLASDKARSSYAAVRSLNLAERLGPSAELAECYGAMCVIAGLIGVHGAAEHYGALARRTADCLGDDFAIAITLHQHCMYRSSKCARGRPHPARLRADVRDRLARALALRGRAPVAPGTPRARAAGLAAQPCSRSRARHALRARARRRGPWRSPASGVGAARAPSSARCRAAARARRAAADARGHAALRR